MNKNNPQITPEHVFYSRRKFLKQAGFLLGGALVLNACGGAMPDSTSEPVSAPTSTPLPAAPPTPTPTRKPGDYTNITDEFGDPATPIEKIRSFGNYYEFTRSHENIGDLAKNISTSPWKIEVGGLVRNPKVFDLDDLKQFGQEERVYRMRCIEAWSFVLPWTGFSLNKLLQVVEPTDEAKFVRFEALYDPENMPGQNIAKYDEWLQSNQADKRDPNLRGMGSPDNSPYTWPYTEGLRLDEAMHDLTMLVTGMYGKPLPPENGAPVRLIVPWKYAVKGIKAITKIELVAEQPATFWNSAMPNEFGFYANVNPDVPHPRWKQGREMRFLGQSPEPILPTLPFNGYATEVAHLYEGMDLTVNF